MKLWEIAVSDKVDPEVRKKLKRLLRPTLSVTGPAKCYLCGTETTWAVNNENVCPACNLKYGFMPDYAIPDSCEVCGRQGEWCTQGDPVHSLCFIHRDQWFHWKTPELDYIDSRKEPEKWCRAWEEGWTRFIACVKEQVSV